MQDRGGIDIREAFHRRQLCSGKKRGDAVGRTKRGKGSRIMAIADALPVFLSPPALQVLRCMK